MYIKLPTPLQAFDDEKSAFTINQDEGELLRFPFTEKGTSYKMRLRNQA